MAKTAAKKIEYKIGDYVRRDTTDGMGYLPNLHTCTKCNRELMVWLKSHNMLVCYGCNRVVAFLDDPNLTAINDEQVAELEGIIRVQADEIKQMKTHLDLEPKKSSKSAKKKKK